MLKLRWAGDLIIKRPVHQSPALRDEGGKPLSPTARRAGWIGCNFALNRVPGSARIPVVSEGAISFPAEVRERYHLARKQVEGLTIKQRGWRLDVLRVIQSLGKTEFSTSDVYAYERELAELRPGNEHVRENPVNYMVTRGRNSPATSGLARPEFTFAYRPQLLASAVRLRDTITVPIRVIALK
jgi:hypothetical protein